MTAGMRRWNYATFGFLFLDKLVPSRLRREAGAMRADRRSVMCLRQPETNMLDYHAFFISPFPVEWLIGSSLQPHP